MTLDELMSQMLTAFLGRYVDEENMMDAAADLSSIVAFGLRSTEEAMHEAFRQALQEKLPDVRRCVIDELLHPPSN